MKTREMKAQLEPEHLTCERPRLPSPSSKTKRFSQNAFRVSWVSEQDRDPETPQGNGKDSNLTGHILQ